MASTTAPEAVSDYERERGKPMPSLNHGVVQARLVGALLKHGDQYTIASELSLALNPPATPDICVYPKFDIDWLNDKIRMQELPLLVIEIQSPSQGTQEMLDKIQRYLEAGIKSAWLVEPSFKLIAVYAANSEPQIYTQGEVVDPTTGISITIEEIFR